MTSFDPRMAQAVPTIATKNTEDTKTKEMPALLSSAPDDGALVSLSRIIGGAIAVK